MARTQFVNSNFKYPLSAGGTGIRNNRDFWKATLNDLIAVADLVDPSPTITNGVVTASGAGNVPILTAAGAAVLGVPFVITVALANAAGADYDFVVPVKLEVLDVSINKSSAGAGNTTTIKNGTTAITDAIAADTDKAVTRAGTIDPAQATISAAGTLRITTTRAAGSAQQKVNITVVRRA